MFVTSKIPQLRDHVRAMELEMIDPLRLCVFALIIVPYVLGL